MAQHQDLGVLGAIAAGQQGQPAKRTQGGEVGES